MALSSNDGVLSEPPSVHQMTRAVETEVTRRMGPEPFRLFVEAVTDYAIFMLDSEGRVISWNSGAKRLKGYNVDEIIGKHFSVFYTEGDLRTKKPWRELEIAAREGRVEDEGWRVRKDGTHFWANVVITALKDRNGRLYGFGKVTRDLTERMRAESDLRRANEELRELSGQLLRAQDEERRRIGRELHDSTGQNLAVLSMNLTTLEQQARSVDPQLAALIAENASLSQKIAEELRTIFYLLHPPLLDEMGLQPALRWYIEGFSKRSSTLVNLEMPERLERLPREMETAIFRIVQECLTNIHRHAQASCATIRIICEPDRLLLQVTDTGKGMSPAQLAKVTSIGSHGIGLRGMRERVRDFGGVWEIESDRHGTKVNVEIPLPTERQPGIPPSSQSDFKP